MVSPHAAVLALRRPVGAEQRRGSDRCGEEVATRRADNRTSSLTIPLKDLNWVAAANSLRITYNGQPLLYASMVNSAQAIASVVSCSLDMALNKDPFTVNPTTPPATRPVTPVDPFKDA